MKLYGYVGVSVFFLYFCYSLLKFQKHDDANFHLAMLYYTAFVSRK